MTEAKFVTKEQAENLREEMVNKIIDVVDGKPAAVNIVALLEVLLIVCVDFGMSEDRFIEMVSSTALQYYHNERTEGVLQ